MIRTLRKKFIITAMLSVFAVLLLIMGSINVVNFRDVIRNANLRMDFLAKEGAAAPPAEGGAPAQTPGEKKEKLKPGEGGFFFGKNGLTAEAHYDSRYFTVLFNADGKVTEINTGKIAAVSTEEAEQMAAALYAKGKTAGLPHHGFWQVPL